MKKGASIRTVEGPDTHASRDSARGCGGWGDGIILMLMRLLVSIYTIHHLLVKCGWVGVRAFSFIYD